MRLVVLLLFLGSLALLQSPPSNLEEMQKSAAAAAAADRDRQEAVLRGARPPASSSFTEPLAYIEAARRALRWVQTYKATYSRKEWIGNQYHLASDTLYVRHQPFSIRLEHPGRTVTWTMGDAKMLVRDRLQLHLAPEVSISNGESRRTVRELGVANITERYGKAWEAEQYQGLTDIQVEDHCVTAKHPAGTESQFAFGMVKVWFHPINHLPWKSENYDFNGHLLERYVYTDIELNVELPTGLFNSR